MADLEPWTYPMLNHYRYRDGSGFCPKSKEKEDDIPITKISEAFPWAAKSSGKKQAPKTEAGPKQAVESYLTEMDVKWKKDFEKKRTNYNVDYKPLYEDLKDTYDPIKVLAAGVDTGAMSSKDDLENIFGSSNSHNSSNNLGKSKHFTHVQKARDRVRISRGRVEMYEQELESTIPDSDLFHSKRRGTLASVLFHNFCICDLKVASNASDAHLGDIHEIVNVVGDQAEELLLLIEQLINAPRTTDTNGTMIKAYANALRTAISDLFLLDGTELGWSSVRKAVQQIASIAQKADAAVIFLEHHSDTSDDAFGIPPVLPVSLKLRKPRGQQEDQQQQQKQQQRRPQRSRIEEYYFQTIPEVQRDAMEMKEMINGLAKKAKQNAKAHGLGGAQKREGVTALLNAQVLRAVTTYKAPTASGLSRMDKGVELKVQQALHDIGRMQMDNAERKRRQLYAGA